MKIKDLAKFSSSVKIVRGGLIGKIMTLMNLNVREKGENRIIFKIFQTNLSHIWIQKVCQLISQSEINKKMKEDHLKESQSSKWFKIGQIWTKMLDSKFHSKLTNKSQIQAKSAKNVAVPISKIRSKWLIHPIYICLLKVVAYKVASVSRTCPPTKYPLSSRWSINSLLLPIFKLVRDKIQVPKSWNWLTILQKIRLISMIRLLTVLRVVLTTGMGVRRHKSPIATLRNKAILMQPLLGCSKIFSQLQICSHIRVEGTIRDSRRWIKMKRRKIIHQIRSFLMIHLTIWRKGNMKIKEKIWKFNR